MSDRTAQARAEAERYMHRVIPYDTMADHYSAIAAFVDGAVWADANPKPTAITLAKFEDAYTYWFDGFPSREKTFEFLWALGIEVEDDE